MISARSNAMARTIVARDDTTAPLMLVVTTLCAIPALFPLSREGAAIGIGFLTVMPWLILTLRAQRITVSDPIVVVGFMYFIACTLPILLQTVVDGFYKDRLWNQMVPWALDEAALWMYRGWSACAIAYWTVNVLAPFRASHRYDRRQERVRNIMRLTLGLIGLTGSCSFLIYTGGQSYSHLEGFIETSSIGMVIHELRVFSVIYVFLHFWDSANGKLYSFEKYLLFAILGASGLIVAATSSKLLPIELASAWLLGTASSGKRGSIIRDTLRIAFLLGFLYCVFYIIFAYRAETRLNEPRPGAPFEEVLSDQMKALGVAFEGLIMWRPLSDGGQTYDVGNMFERLAFVLDLGRVIEYTNGKPPYENAAESFAIPILAFLPRDLMSNKVQFMDTATWAQMYAGWTHGGLSMSLFGSLYWAWGYEGIILGMIGYGCMIALLRRSASGIGPGALIASALLMRFVIGMLDVGAEFQPQITGLFRSGAALLVLFLTAQAVVAMSAKVRRPAGIGSNFPVR